MSVTNIHKIEGVHEYAEEMDMEFGVTEASEYSNAPPGRKVIIAYNEGGHNCVNIDFEELKAWIYAHPDGVS